MYRKGLHIITGIEVAEPSLLQQYDAFKSLLEKIVLDFELKELGAVYHNFSPQGFTAVVCLSESHISVHTWPEHNLVNYDIYLSNHERVNDDTVHKIDQLFQSFFKGKLLQSQHINR